MLKVSKNFSLGLSLFIAGIFLLCCVAGLFIMPGLAQILIDTPDNIGNRQEISQLGRTLVLIASYGILADLITADLLLINLLMLVKKRLVFTEQSVSMIRGVSWCCLLLCALFCFLGLYFQLAFIVALCALFLGICLRVCKNAFEEAISIKEENELTV